MGRPIVTELLIRGAARLIVSTGLRCRVANRLDLRLQAVDLSAELVHSLVCLADHAVELRQVVLKVSDLLFDLDQSAFHGPGL